MSVKGKTAVVTGGSRGIGRAICIALAQAGANVIFSYAGNEQAAEQTKQLCEQEGVKAFAFKADVRDEQQVTELFKQATEQFGTVDILVNNAGITKDGLLLRMSEGDFTDVVDTNLKGTFLCTKAAAKIMLKQKSGSIVNISSVVGLIGNAGQVNYCASKAGVIGLTKSAARELSSRNIRVNAIAPGFIDTDMTAAMTDNAKQAMAGTIPLGRPGSAQDIANAVLFLAGDQAAYITGQTLSVDGGMAM